MEKLRRTHVAAVGVEDTATVLVRKLKRVDFPLVFHSMSMLTQRRWSASATNAHLATVHQPCTRMMPSSCAWAPRLVVDVRLQLGYHVSGQRCDAPFRNEIFGEWREVRTMNLTEVATVRQGKIQLRMQHMCACRVGLQDHKPIRQHAQWCACEHCADAGRGVATSRVCGPSRSSWQRRQSETAQGPQSRP